METGLFDVPFSRVEEISGNQAPWVNGNIAENKIEDKTVPVAEARHSKVKERKRYSQKLAKQLQSIGIDVDVVSGVENKHDDGVESKHDDEDMSSAEKESMKTPTATNKTNKGLLENIADETLQALETSSTGVESNADNESLSGWDPMKASYEQKSFNSYQIQRYDDNFLEKHKPICGPDGKKHISPTKVSSEDIRLYITNIPISLSEDGLRNMFSSVGKCKDVKKCRIREGEETTFGFVTYTSVREAESAIIKYNDFGFGGETKLRVKLAHNRNPHEDIRWGNDKRTDNELDWEDGKGGAVTSPINENVSSKSKMAGNARNQTSQESRSNIGSEKKNYADDYYDKLYEDLSGSSENDAVSNEATSLAENGEDIKKRYTQFC